MNEILKQIDAIHAEAVKRMEHDDMLSPENGYLRNKNAEHIANIVKLRQMVNIVFNRLATQTTEDRGEYYHDDDNAETNLDKLRSEFGSTANEETDDLGFQEFQNQKK